ncbi:MAG TPA: hypothetical protein VK395_10165 [Gemmataceae bacterium]|nr:hypothetical protein [Gemmataceae bacterium]
MINVVCSKAEIRKGQPGGHRYQLISMIHPSSAATPLACGGLQIVMENWPIPQ